MSKKQKDRTELLEERVKDLKRILRSKDRTIRQLKSEVKTAEDAFNVTEVFLKEVTDDRPMSEILRTVESNQPLSKLGDACPNCNQRSMKKILFTGFHIVSCECGYRTRVDEGRAITKTK